MSPGIMKKAILSLFIFCLKLATSVRIGLDEATIVASINESLYKSNQTIDLQNLLGPQFSLSYEESEQSGRMIFSLTTPINWITWFGMSDNILMNTSPNMIIFQHILPSNQLDESKSDQQKQSETSSSQLVSNSLANVKNQQEQLVNAEANTTQGFIEIYSAGSHSYGPPQKKEQDTLVILEHIVTSGIRRITFECDFVTNDSTLFSIAHGPSPLMRFHGNRANRYIVSLTQGQANDKSDDVIVPKWIYKLHTSLLLYGWGFLVDIGILVGRYCKGWKHYTLLHATIFLTVNITTIVLDSLLFLYNQARINAIQNPEILIHYMMSGLLFFIMIFQHFVGYQMKNSIESLQKYKAFLTLKQLKKVHFYLGFFIYFFAKGIIITGKWSSSILKNNKKTHFESAANASITFTVMIIGWMILERFYRLDRVQNNPVMFILGKILSLKKEDKNVEEQKLREHKELLRLLNRQLSSHEISEQLPSVKYALIGNKVFDLSEFLHPGGQHLFEFGFGRDLYRFITGQQPMEGFDQSTVFNHPTRSIAFLSTKQIGNLDISNRSFLQRSKRPSSEKQQSYEIELDSFADSKTNEQGFRPLRENLQTEVHSESSSFSIQNIEGALIMFKSKEGLKVRNEMQGLGWMGAHFSIQPENLKKDRLYTSVLCMTTRNRNRTQLISQYFNNKVNLQDVIAEIDPSEVSYSDELPLVIKKYTHEGAVSKYIHENRSGLFKIEGPIGRGLEMADTFNGRICIFANGTGVLPFLDLLNFMLLRNIRNQAKEKGILTKNQNGFSECGSQLSVQMFASFSSVEEFYGKQIVENLLRSEQNLKKKTFSLTIRLPSLQDTRTLSELGVQFRNEHFKQKMIEDIEASSLEQADRIYISGSNDLYQALATPLRNSSYVKNKLFFV